MLQIKRRDYKITTQYNILVRKIHLKQKNNTTFKWYWVALQHFIVKFPVFLSNLLNIPVSL